MHSVVCDDQVESETGWKQGFTQFRKDFKDMSARQKQKQVNICKNLDDCAWLKQRIEEDKAYCKQFSKLNNSPSSESVADLPSSESVADLPSSEYVSDLPSSEPVADLPSSEPVADLPSGGRVLRPPPPVPSTVEASDASAEASDASAEEGFTNASSLDESIYVVNGSERWVLDGKYNLDWGNEMNEFNFTNVSNNSDEFINDSSGDPVSQLGNKIQLTDISGNGPTALFTFKWDPIARSLTITVDGKVVDISFQFMDSNLLWREQCSGWKPLTKNGATFTVNNLDNSNALGDLKEQKVRISCGLYYLGFVLNLLILTRFPVGIANFPLKLLIVIINFSMFVAAFSATTHIFTNFLIDTIPEAILSWVEVVLWLLSTSILLFIKRIYNPPKFSLPKGNR